MANSVEIFEAGKIYHLFSRSIGNQRLFLNHENYGFFLSRYHFYCNDCFDTLAYCLIPNHFHFLVRVKEDKQDKDVLRSFSNFLNSYAKAFNKSTGRNGGLFQRKFKRILIDQESYLSRVIVYIHLNPIKHTLAHNLNEWRYSSFASYMTDRPTKISRELGLEWFGGRSEFLKIHENSREDYLPEEYLLE